MNKLRISVMSGLFDILVVQEAIEKDLRFGPEDTAVVKMLARIVQSSLKPYRVAVRNGVISSHEYAFQANKIYNKFFAELASITGPEYYEELLEAPANKNLFLVDSSDYRS